MLPMTNLILRSATAADDAALYRLAQLDSSVVPAAPRLIAEADGQLIAAVSARDGGAIADPFTRSAHAVALLRRRLQTPSRSRRPRLAPRFA
jgi:hypothetical protein